MRSTIKTYSLVLLAFVVVSAGCGGDDDDGDDDDVVMPDAAVVPDAAPAGEPCDFQNPASVALAETVTREQPTAACLSGIHFYRFTPSVTGVYTITKSGGASLGFCETEDTDGCICGININCCTDCTLTFDLPNGDPLPMNSNNQIYISPNMPAEDYTFTITGPN